MVRQLVRNLAILATAVFLALSPAVGQKPGSKKSNPTPKPPPVVTPLCLTGCVTYSVSVTPDAGAVNVISNTTDTVAFIVQNTGTGADEYTITCTSTGDVTCLSLIKGGMPMAFKICDSCGALQASSLPPVQTLCIHCGLSDTLYENPNQIREVDVVYSVGTSGGSVTLTASGNAPPDAGSYTVSAGTMQAPIAALRNYNPDNHDRSLCLTSGAGEAGAWECGDLVLTHALPGYSTIGHDRSLTLLYNSAQAVPMPAVAVSITDGGSIYPPNSVFLRLSVNGTARDSASYFSWGQSPLTRQAVVAFADTTDSSGIYPFTLLVRNQYSGSNRDTTLSGNLIIVNRANSQFGRGWSLVGVEKLYLNQGSGRILWVDGDGSGVEYDSIAANTWRAAAGSFRDTLKYDPVATQYTRYLRHRVRVIFDAGGRHIQTINRTGQVANFYWTTASNRLDSISVPPAKLPSTTYKLVYDGNGKLDKITDPAGRILDATVTGNRLLSLQDPDTKTVSFVYDAAGRITKRTNRRGFTTLYGFGLGFRMDTVRVPIGRTSADTSSRSVTAFRPWDEQGFQSTGFGTTVDTGLAYTKVDGARTDVADTAEFWVDRWGAPVKIQDPLGHVTTITRGDAKNPAEVTRVRNALGRVLLATYDSLRGNLLTQTDSTHQGSDTTTYNSAVSTYTYGDANVLDSPTKIKTPIDSTLFTYDATLGVPTVVTAMGGHHTVMAYFSSGWRQGLLHTVAEDSVKLVDTTITGSWPKSLVNAVTRFEYDTLGNDTLAVSPKGITTRYVRDTYTRVHNLFDGRQHQTDYYYDVMNAIDTVAFHETVPTATTLITRYHHTLNEAVDSVIDPRGVKRSWVYDLGDRVISLSDASTRTANYFYDPAGLVDSIRSRHGNLIRNKYDAGGNATLLAWSSQVDTFFTVSSTPYTVTESGDSIIRTYDAGDRLLTATRGASIVTRAYNLEGTLRSERQQFNSHDVTLRYMYDIGDRRSVFFNGEDTITYRYGADARLASERIKWMSSGFAAESIGYFWDGAGRRDSMQYYGNGTSVNYGYDLDGHLRMVCSRHPGGSPTDYLDHTVLYTGLDSAGNVAAMQEYANVTGSCGTVAGTMIQSFTASYDARNEMVQQASGPLNITNFHYDPSGNLTWKNLQGLKSDSFPIYAGTNSVNADVVWDSTTNPKDIRDTIYTYSYNFDAEQTARYRLHLAGRPGYMMYFHNAIGQIMGDSAYLTTNQVGSLTNCAYDGLGRRIQPCQGVVGWQLFDGDNTIGACCIGSWRFAQGPGTDDPVAAIDSISATGLQEYYYLTDGQGRHLAMTLPDGTDADPVTFAQNGGNLAGSIGNANSFANTRVESPQMPGISFYRNRYYDQGTGRFLDEDPAGIAGGVNLYAYVGNNPATHTDPFGLCPDGCVLEAAGVGVAVGVVALAATTVALAHGNSLGNSTHAGARAGANVLQGAAKAGRAALATTANVGRMVAAAATVRAQHTAESVRTTIGVLVRLWGSILGAGGAIHERPVEEARPPVVQPATPGGQGSPGPSGGGAGSGGGSGGGPPSGGGSGSPNTA